MSYSDDLKDPRWQKKRLEIFERDQFSCQICLDTTSPIHVHHLTYEKGKRPWEYDDSNFKTLCVDCHQAISDHRKLYVTEDGFDAMRATGNGDKIHISYSHGEILIKFFRPIESLRLTSPSLKKIVHFIINNWLKDGK